jgi:hypothetical protein
VNLEQSIQAARIHHLMSDVSFSILLVINRIQQCHHCLPDEFGERIPG